MEPIEILIQWLKKQEKDMYRPIPGCINIREVINFAIDSFSKYEHNKEKPK